VTVTDTNQTRDRRCRETHPETIDIGTDVLIRDDIMAAKNGVTTRTQTRGDKDGAPFCYVGNVKYRPMQGYMDYMKSRIQIRGRALKKHRRG
jgi:hypothetical protein